MKETSGVFIDGDVPVMMQVREILKQSKESELFDPRSIDFFGERDTAVFVPVLQQQVLGVSFKTFGEGILCFSGFRFLWPSER